MTRLARPFLILSLVILTSLTVWRAYLSWSNNVHIDQTGGVWLSLAYDFKEGELYRPLQSEVGYGGTRYFPLNIMFYGSLMKMGLEPRVAGYTVSFFSVTLLLTGVYFFLRRSGSSRAMSLVFSTLVLAADSAQYGLLTTRGEVLPAALSIWGMTVCLKGKGALSGRTILLASCLFALAFAAKVTALSGIASAFVAYYFSQNKSIAWKLLLFTIVGMVVLLGLSNYLSHGRLFENLKTWFVGGSGISYFLKSPFRAPYSLMHEDPGGIIFVVLGLACLFDLNRAEFVTMAPLFLIFTLISTVFIYGMRGTAENQLIDLHAASLIMLGWWGMNRPVLQPEFRMAVLAVATVFASVAILHYTVNPEQGVNRRENLAQLRRELPPGPILAENPLLNVLRDERAYVVDPYMFSLLNNNDPTFGSGLWDRLRKKYFQAIVLLRDPTSENGRRWYETKHYGKGFIEQLSENYRFERKVGEEWVYLPKTQPGK